MTSLVESTSSLLWKSSRYDELAFTNAFQRRLCQPLFPQHLVFIVQAFLDSKLASTIPTDFKVSEIRKEVYNLLHVLRPEEKNSLVGNGAGI